MEVKIGNDKINIELNFKRISEIEKQVGSIYSLLEKVTNKEISFSDVICFYYNGQSDASYSEEQLYKMIAKDGLTVHIGNVYNITLELLVGEETVSKITKEAEKEEADNLKKN